MWFISDPRQQAMWFHKQFIEFLFGRPPHSNSGKWRIIGIPHKNESPLVVTATAKGAHAKISIWSLPLADLCTFIFPTKSLATWDVSWCKYYIIYIIGSISHTMASNKYNFSPASTKRELGRLAALIKWKDGRLSQIFLQTVPLNSLLLALKKSKRKTKNAVGEGGRKKGKQLREGLVQEPSAQRDWFLRRNGCPKARHAYLVNCSSLSRRMWSTRNCAVSQIPFSAKLLTHSCKHRKNFHDQKSWYLYGDLEPWTLIIYSLQHHYGSHGNLQTSIINNPNAMAPTATSLWCWVPHRPGDMKQK